MKYQSLFSDFRFPILKFTLTRSEIYQMVRYMALSWFHCTTAVGLSNSKPNPADCYFMVSATLFFYTLNPVVSLQLQKQTQLFMKTKIEYLM